RPVDNAVAAEPRVDDVRNRDGTGSGQARGRIDRRRPGLGDAERRNQRVVGRARDALAHDRIQEAAPVVRGARTFASRAAAVVRARDLGRAGARAVDGSRRTLRFADRRPGDLPAERLARPRPSAGTVAVTVTRTGVVAAAVAGIETRGRLRLAVAEAA